MSLQYFDAHNKKVQDRISTFTSTVHRKLKTFGRNVNDLMRQLHLSQRASERMERVGRGLESSTVMAGGVVHTSPVFTFTPHMHAQSQIIQPAQSAQSAQSSGERWRRKAPLTTHHAARSKNKDSSTAHTSTRPSEHSFTRAELNGYLQHKMVVVGRGKEKEEKEGVRTLRMMLEQEPEAQAREEDVYRLEYGARAHIDIHERSRDGMDRGGGERGGVGNERGAMRIQGDRDNGVEDDMERRRVYKQAFSALEMIQPTHNSQKTQTLVHTNPHPANHEKALFVPHPPRHAPPPQIE